MCRTVKLQDLFTVFHDIASGLQYLHSMGIILGQISADAILVRRVAGRLEVITLRAHNVVAALNS